MDELIVRFADTSKVTWQNAKSLSYVTSDDIALADKYVQEEDKVAHLVSAYFKRKYIGEWQIAKSGKPFAEGKHFNVSHTQGAVVFVEAKKEIGIDVERIRPTDEDLRRYISTNEEYAIITDDKSFFEIWTAKESLAKATGEGVASPSHIPALPLDGAKTHNGAPFFSQHAATNDCILSVTREGETPFIIKIIPE